MVLFFGGFDGCIADLCIFCAEMQAFFSIYDSTLSDL